MRHFLLVFYIFPDFLSTQFLGSYDMSVKIVDIKLDSGPFEMEAMKA